MRMERRSLLQSLSELSCRQRALFADSHTKPLPVEIPVPIRSLQRCCEGWLLCIRSLTGCWSGLRASSPCVHTHWSILLSSTAELGCSHVCIWSNICACVKHLIEIGQI